MPEIILAIDQGTTGSTAVLVDRDLRIYGSVNEEYPQHYPHAGWVEHDPEDIWRSVESVVRKVLARTRVNVADIAVIGITNQRETVVGWEAQSGQPIHNAVVWQCRRTADVCKKLKDEGLEPLFQKRTGLVLDPYFSGTKIAWILDHVEGARDRLDDLRFGTIDSFLVSRLTQGEVHVTDVSNASRTLLMNLASCTWDEELAKHLRVPLQVMPEIRSSSEVYGRTKGLSFLPDGIPIAGIAGDQQAALFGQTCFDVGEAKCTYGTGAFMLMNVGHTPKVSANGLLSTAAWRIGDKTTYALEGSAFVAGAIVQWLRDGLGIISSSKEVEELARSVPDSNGVVLVPALAGLGAPHWNPQARGVIWGLTAGVTRAHVARAALEGIAFQCHDILKAMEEDVGAPLQVLRIDGGAAANNLLMQFQADLLEVEISRPEVLETTALGAALLAGLGVGFFDGLEDIRRIWREELRFTPAMDDETRTAHLDRWRAGIARV